MASLPRPVATLLAAANGHDTDAFVACFTEDGVIDDWGREFRGPGAIRAWSDAEFVGVDVRLEVVGVTASDRSVTVRAMVGGNGFNGPSHFTFTPDGDRVARMEIRA
jgi:hypothetical protein